MSESIKSVRGMNDVVPPESGKWLYFERRCREVFENYGYDEVRTPIVESTALFSRGIGEATDIVEKEMYTFPDRKGRSLTMRPEMTASCVRSYIQHGIAKREPVTRWYYSGPMFRYERMQTGRYRQFYQMGVEAFGVAEPTVEAEQIAMLFALYRSLDFQGLKAVINSVGSGEDRPRYRAALLAYLEPHRSALCGDCQRRLETNPLRTLDCKNPTCRELVADAPSVLDHLGDEGKAHFEEAQRTLDALGVPYEVDHRMVRGLDYYTGTVFEILSESEALGTQSTIVAGGRYDNLVASLGGGDVPAVGFALGVERNLLCLPGDEAAFTPRPAVYIVSRGSEARVRALEIAEELRALGLRTEVEHRGVGFKAQFKRADRLGARAAITIGEAELAEDRVNLRNLATSEEAQVARADLVDAVRGIVAPPERA